MIRVALVCDFCHPNLGGIESHLLKLATELRLRNHHVSTDNRFLVRQVVTRVPQVVIITHSYPGYHGRQHWDDGTVVYYSPLPTIARQVG